MGSEMCIRDSPEWSNTYNRVEVLLITHSCDGLSDLDIKLAQEMEMASSF